MINKIMTEVTLKHKTNYILYHILRNIVATTIVIYYLNPQQLLFTRNNILFLWNYI